MKLILASLLLVTIFFASCEKDHGAPPSGVAVLSGANQVPAVNTTAGDTVWYQYNRGTKMLTYKIKYSGLSGNPIVNSSTVTNGSGIYGPASKGALGPLLQAISFPTSSANPIKQGILTGSLAIDGFAITEDRLLAGFYYINIKTQANPGGEVRAQLTF